MRNYRAGFEWGLLMTMAMICADCCRSWLALLSSADIIDQIIRMNAEDMAFL